jgi:4-hydroxy-3-methylbut-2-en-1-yl diphosphate synthase IspG/GcpE
MTKTETADLEATMAQIHRVAEAGADIVRCAVPREKDAEALKTIVASRRSRSSPTSTSTTRSRSRRSTPAPTACG